MSATCEHDLAALDLDDYLVCGVCGANYIWTEGEVASIKARAEAWAARFKEMTDG
jgi:hypothetical protein